jgi:phenylacetate-CoA ligase
MVPDADITSMRRGRSRSATSGGAATPILNDPAAALIRHVLFPAWVRKNRSTRLAYVAQFERSQFFSRWELQELQWTQFKTLLRHAFDHCAFYRRKLSAIGMVPDDVRTPDDIARVPTTSKEEIQEWLRDLIADNVSGPLIKDMTGGSTGSPMVFYYDEDRLDSRNAAAIRHNRWTGWDIGDKMAVLWGAPRDLASGSMKARVRDWILDRRVMLDASSIDDDRMRAFHRRLLDHQPKFVLAYANTMALFARFLRDSGLEPPQPKGIITSGEVLTAENRALIESTFGCRVYNRYGCREFAVIASECGHHRGMHINAENLLVDVVSGEIVITDLKNFAMPMIRYRTRDAGAPIPGVCDCGRGLPLLDVTGGRVTEFLTALGGQKVSGIVLATYAITSIPGVGQIQFVQDRADRVRARIVRRSEWSDDSAATLIAKVRGFLGAAMTVDLEFVEAIPLEASGKYRFSISSLGPR